MELLLNIKVESKKEWIKENKGNDGTTLQCTEIA